MPAYLISMVDVTDPKAYQEYVKRAVPVLAKFGGKFLVRGGRQLGLEGAPPPQRMALIEFPDLETVERFYRSPEYQEAKKIRKGAAEMRLNAVEGV